MNNTQDLFSESKVPAKGVEPAPDYLGHRSRMRQKLLEKGAQSLSEIELLELILMTALPRRDVKPLAKQLMRQFLNIQGIIHADVTQLSEINGVKESVISLLKLIEGTCSVLLKPDMKKGTVLSDWHKIIDYCRLHLSHEKCEHLYLIYLDKRMKIITIDDFQKGSQSHLPVYPQEILKRALNLNASKLIMVHNHPSGEASPSVADIQQTNDLIDFLENTGIAIYDHLIIGNNQVYSLNHRKIMDEF